VNEDARDIKRHREPWNVVARVRVRNYVIRESQSAAVLDWQKTLGQMLLVLFLVTLGFALLLQVPSLLDTDQQAFLWVNAHYWPPLADVAGAITFLGSLEMGAIWVVALYLLKRRDLASYVAIAVIIELIYVILAKDIVNRPRPYETYPLIPHFYETVGQSFPSAHAAGAFAVGTVLSVKVRRYAIPLIGIAALVAASRVYIGVHYPLDVIAGSLGGVVIGWYCAKLDVTKFRAYFRHLAASLKTHVSES